VSGAGQTQPLWCPSLGRDVIGISVVVTHPVTSGERFSTLYAHLSRADVQAGQIVSRGTQIGLSGNTGCSVVPHLHFQVNRLTNTNGSGPSVMDPYGWEGDGADPWAAHPEGASSIWLWLPGQAPPIGEPCFTVPGDCWPR
jgi:murein DD-endopeptidase MepM/ murein hydrolase activator NlpD